MIWIKQQKIILFELSPLKLKVNTCMIIVIIHRCVRYFRGNVTDR